MYCVINVEKYEFRKINRAQYAILNDCTMQFKCVKYI